MADFSPIPFGPGLVLHRRLGVGGMAEVFRGVQTGVGGFQKVVAVKRMLPNLAEAGDFEKMFQAEVNLTGRLQHPNIVQVFGNGEHDGYLYVVMEYVNGRDLAKILGVLGQKSEALPIPIGVLIASEVARGLDYAHSFRDAETDQRECLVHRDISPQNIMVTFDGQVKVVDFGIAKVTDGVESARTGTVRGKLAYMAPEQAAGAAFDHRIDIFALGVVLHECLTGARLFRGANQADTLRRVLMCQVVPPSAKNPAVPPELDEIVMRALAREQDERYASAFELQRDLSKWLGANAPGLVPREMGTYLATLFAEAISAERDADRLISSEYAPTSNTPLTGERARTGSQSGASMISGSSSARLLVMPPRAEPTRSMPTVIAVVLALVLSGVAAMKFFGAPADVPAQLPSSVEGLAGWYRADTLKLGPNQRVERWPSAVTDIPGDAIQPEGGRQPTFQTSVISGSPVVQFDGQKQFLSADDLTGVLRRGTGMTIMFVGRVLEDRPQFVVSVQQQDGNVDVARIGFAQPQVIRVKMSPDPVATQYLDSKTQLLFGFAIYSVVVERSHVEVYFDGKSVISDGIDAPQISLARRVSIGQEFDEGNVPSDFFAGQIAELAIYDRALSSDARRAVEAYFAKKYALRQ